jgi:predicted heme/steroid binding protein
MVQIWTWVLATVATVGGLHGAILLNKDKFDRFIMGIVRDVGRHKARQRRYNNSKGLVLTLLHRDDPLEDLLDLRVSDDNDADLATYTEAELLEFGDGREGRPILISVFGRVYDVSAGSKFYGPNGAYGMFAGHDITYSLSTGCRTVDCLEMSAEGLDDKLLNEGKRWLSFFHLHDKYPLVGKLETDYLELVMSGIERLGKGEDGKPLNKPPIF